MRWSLAADLSSAKSPELASAGRSCSDGGASQACEKGNERVRSEEGDDLLRVILSFLDTPILLF
jgi:hypothetical protein